jgi:hypothetical protein
MNIKRQILGAFYEEITTALMGVQEMWRLSDFKVTYFKEQIRCREANSHSPSEEISSTLFTGAHHCALNYST